jgi:hypothetical protein
LKASVSRWRVYLWLAVNSLLTCSGIALLVIQSRCSRAPVIDTPAAAITTVPYFSGLKQTWNLSYVTSSDVDLGMLQWTSKYAPSQ